MLVYILLIIFSFYVFYFSGKLFMPFFKKGETDFADKSILGIILFYLVAGAYQIFFPLNIFFTSFYFLLLVFLLLFRNGRNAINFKDLKPIYLLSLGGIFFYFFAVSGDFTYDHLLYHDQAVAWFNQYKLIPGLANLHGRFGFNNSFFPIVAAFQIDYKSNYYFINSLIALMLILKFYTFIKRKTDVRSIVVILFLSLSIFTYGLDYFSGISPDFQILALVIILLINLLEGDFFAAENFNFNLLLLVFMLTVKLNVALLVATLVLYLILCLVKQGKFRILKQGIIVPSLLMLIFITRSIILTGQILYPLPSFYLSVFPHSVSKKQVVNERIGVIGWAQNPGSDYHMNYEKNKGTLNWVSTWYNKRFNHTYSRLPIIGKISIRVFAFLSILGGFLMVFYSIRKRNTNLIVIVLAVFLNLIFWFLNAPDYRFGYLNFVFLMTLNLYNFNNNIRFIYFFFIIITSIFQFKNFLINYSVKLNIAQFHLFKLESHSNKVVNSKITYLNYNNSHSVFWYYFSVNNDQSRIDVFPSLTHELKNDEIQIIENHKNFIIKNNK